MKRSTTLIFLSLSMLLTALPTQAATVILTSNLNALNSAPQNSSTATGTALMNFDDVTNQFNLSIDINGITTTTLTNSHIHLGASGVNGIVIFPIGTTGWTNNTSGGMSLGLTGKSFPTAYVADLLAGNTYLNFHTQTFAGGEIRGQLVAVAPVPLPAAAWLLGSGLIGLVGASRKKGARS